MEWIAIAIGVVGLAGVVAYFIRKPATEKVVVIDNVDERHEERVEEIEEQYEEDRRNPPDVSDVNAELERLRARSNKRRKR